jgi:hypothetical protein
MKFIVLIYNDPELLGSVPQAEFNATMRECLSHADELRRDGKLLDAQMLESPATARTVRIRAGCVEVRPVRDIAGVRERVS